ncbi:hypothetical protein L1887_60650 [Cichorium endivia]|nr:hypothetical protein L1887_60650 [Cichorium endivia]
MKQRPGRLFKDRLLLYAFGTVPNREVRGADWTAAAAAASFGEVKLASMRCCLAVMVEGAEAERPAEKWPAAVATSGSAVFFCQLRLLLPASPAAAAAAAAAGNFAPLFLAARLLLRPHSAITQLHRVAKNVERRDPEAVGWAGDARLSRSSSSSISSLSSEPSPSSSPIDIG